MKLYTYKIIVNSYLFAILVISLPVYLPLYSMEQKNSQAQRDIETSQTHARSYYNDSLEINDDIKESDEEFYTRMLNNNSFFDFILTIAPEIIINILGK